MKNLVLKEPFLKKSSEAIEPTNIVRINDIHLVAKRIADGFLQGLQSSRQRGLGIEFNQYRAYEVGDELSRIDWKLFARSDRYFVREAERESEIDVWFLLDSSRSMLQSNKLKYAKTLIASLSYLVQNQGDEFGFIGLSSDKLSFVAKGNGQKHWHKLLLALNHVQAGQYFPPLDMLNNHLAQLQRPSIIFLISDFYQQDNEIIQLLSQINRSRSEVVALHLYSKQDENFSIATDHRKSMIRFKDLETQEELLVSASTLKKNYEKNYNVFLDKLKNSFSELGIESSLLDIEKPMTQALSFYLNKRLRNR